MPQIVIFRFTDKIGTIPDILTIIWKSLALFWTKLGLFRTIPDKVSPTLDKAGTILHKVCTIRDKVETVPDKIGTTLITKNFGQFEFRTRLVRNSNCPKLSSPKLNTVRNF